MQDFAQFWNKINVLLHFFIQECYLGISEHVWTCFGSSKFGLRTRCSMEIELLAPKIRLFAGFCTILATKSMSYSTFSSRNVTWSYLNMFEHVLGHLSLGCALVVQWKLNFYHRKYDFLQDFAQFWQQIHCLTPLFQPGMIPGHIWTCLNKFWFI